MQGVRIQSIPSSFLNTLKLSEDQKVLIISEEDVTIIDILCPGQLILIKSTKPTTPLIDLPTTTLHSTFLCHHEDGRGTTVGAKVRTAEWSPYFLLKSGWGCMAAVLQTNYHLQVYDSSGKLLFPLHPLLLDVETYGESDQDILQNTCMSWSPPFEMQGGSAAYLATAGRSKFITLFLMQSVPQENPAYCQISKVDHHTKAYITALSWTSTTRERSLILAAGTSCGAVMLFKVELVLEDEVRVEVVLWRKICYDDGYFVSGLQFKNVNRFSMCNPERKSSSAKNYDILSITKGFLLGLVKISLEESDVESDPNPLQIQFYRIHENIITSIRWRKLTTSHDHELFSSSRDGTIKIWKVVLAEDLKVSLKLKGIVPVQDPDNSGIMGCEISPNGLLCLYLYLDSTAKGSDMYSPVLLANLDFREIITTAITTLTRKETLIQFIDAIILGSKSPVIWSWDIKQLFKQRNIWFSSEKILHPLSLAGIQCDLLDHIITIYIQNSDKFPLYIVDRACKISNLLIPLIIPSIKNFHIYKTRKEKQDESTQTGTPEEKKKKKKKRKKGSDEEKESDGTPSKRVKTVPAKDYFLIEQDSEQMQLHIDYIEKYSIQKLEEIVIENKKLISFMHISETLQRFFNLRNYTPVDEREHKCLDLFLLKLQNTENEATSQNLKVIKEQLEDYLSSRNIKEHSVVRCPFCESPLEGGRECPLAHPVRVCSRTLLPITRYGHLHCANCEQMMMDLDLDPFGGSWIINPEYPEYCPVCGMVVRKRVSEFLTSK